MSRKMSYLLITTVAFPMLSLGIALQLKAAIGQSMFNAFAAILADLSGLQIGYTINLLNVIFLTVYILLRREGFKGTDLIQLVAVLINGFLVNIFLYNVLEEITLAAYGIRMAIFISGISLASVSLGAILAMNLIKFPLEGLSLQISKLVGKSLAAVRMRFDVFFLISTVGLCLLFGRDLYIREGTLISFMLLSKLLGLSYNFFKQSIGGAL